MLSEHTSNVLDQGLNSTLGFVIIYVFIVTDFNAY